MKKKNIILIAVLFFLVGLFFYYKSNFSKTQNKTVTITITEEGFNPSKITISKGDTVVWINKGDKLHWPASNFHPTHNLYPEKGGCLGSLFDACKGLSKEESYSFKFNVSGSWPVHDHLFPGLLMIVEVLNLKDSNSKNTSVYNKNTKIEDFRKFNYSEQLDFIRLMSNDSPSKAWSYIKEAFIINNQVVGNAHEFSHIIGNESYKKSGLNGVKICDTTFAFGCFHGVTEAMLLKEGVKVIKVIEVGCLKLFPPDLSQDYTGCIHGTGHGIFTLENGNLNRSLIDCDIISDRYRSYCYDGVFMENSSHKESRTIDLDNPWKLCSSLPERYHRNCARYQSQIFLGTFGKPNSLDLVGKSCERGPSVLMKETCYQSLGFYVAQNSLGNISDIWKKCNGMPSKDGVEICSLGAATEIVFQKYGDFENFSQDLCRKITEPRKSECLNGINNMLNQNAVKN